MKKDNIKKISYHDFEGLIAYSEFELRADTVERSDDYKEGFVTALNWMERFYKEKFSNE